MIKMSVVLLLVFMVLTIPYTDAETLPFVCGFETYSICGMSHYLSSKSFQWDRRYDYGTGTSGTGPSGAYRGNYYIYIDATNEQQGNKAYLRTPGLSYTGDVCISFYYHMYASAAYRSHMGDLIVITTNKGESCPLIKLVGNQGNSWLRQEVQTSLNWGDQVVFIAVRGQGSRGDIALDEISITEGSCTSADSQPFCGANVTFTDLINTTVIISAERKTQVYYSYYSQNEQAIVSIDGEPTEWIPKLATSKPEVDYRTTVQNMRQLGVNYWKRNVVWSNFEYGDVEYGKLNGNIKDVFISKRTAHYFASPKIGGIAVDWVANNVYWTDQVYRWIKMTRLSNSTRDYYTVVNKNIDVPAKICVHPAKSLLFWADIGVKPKIERSDLKGGNRKIILSNDLASPRALDIDYKTNRLYFLDTRNLRIETCLLDGTNRKVFYSSAMFLPSLVSITTYNKYLFGLSNKNHLYIMDTTNPDIVRKFNFTYVRAFDMVVFGKEKQENMTSPCDTLECGGICVGKNNNTEAECLCPDGKEIYLGKFCIASQYFQSPVYVLAGNHSMCMFEVYTPDLGYMERHSPQFNLRQCESSVTTQSFISGTSQSIGQLYKKKYLYIGTENDIYMMVMNSAGKPYLLISGAGNVTDISVDWIANTIYWVDGAGFIKAATITGEYQTTIIAEADIQGIIVDPRVGYLFWTNNKEIKKSKMDGSSVSTVIRGLSRPGHITLDYQEKRLYWVDISYPHVKIHSMRTDGSDLKLIISIEATSYEQSQSIAVFQNHIMWTVRHYYYPVETVRWVYKEPELNVNGTRRSEYLYFASGPLLLYGEYSQPKADTNKCAINNGGCSHICLTIPNGITCKCDVGYILAKDRRTCQPDDIGMPDMLISSKAKHKLMMFNSRNNKSAALPLHDVDLPDIVGVDISKYYIFWTDVGTKDIKRATYPGYHQQTIKSFYNGQLPSGLAVDTVQKKLFYGTFNKSISSIDYDGNNDTEIVIVDTNSPLSIAVDTTKKLLYWSSGGMFPSISVASYEGTNQQTLVGGNKIALPTGLLVDQKNQLLYWCDTALGRIESVSTNGKTRRLINYDFFAKFTGMTSIGQYLYLTDMRSPYLKEVPKTIGKTIKVIGKRVFEQASSIVAFNLSSAPKTTPTIPPSTASTTTDKLQTSTTVPSSTSSKSGQTTSTIHAPSSGKNGTLVSGSEKSKSGLDTSSIIVIAVLCGVALVTILGIALACGIQKSRDAILCRDNNKPLRLNNNVTSDTSSEMASYDGK